MVVVDSSRVHPGRLREVKEALAGLARFVETNEAEPLSYGVYFDEAESLMTVVQVHPDSESMVRHLTVAAAEFAGLGDLLTLVRVDVYGSPSPELLERLRRKADLLGGAPVGVHAFHAGFARHARVGSAGG